MLALTAANLLNLWEEGLQHPSQPERAILLLGAVFPGSSSRELAAFSLGWRDARLLELHREYFGPILRGKAACDLCGNNLEFGLEVNQLLEGTSPEEPMPGKEYREEAGGMEISFRLPTTLDLVEALSKAPGNQALLLAERCLVKASLGEQEIPAAQLPEPVLRRVEECLLEKDPLAEISLALDCPACGKTSRINFDIVSFLWQKISAQARRLLLEMDLLARTYHWSEAEILALSPLRRQLYLQLIRS